MRLLAWRRSKTADRLRPATPRLLSPDAAGMEQGQAVKPTRSWTMLCHEEALQIYEEDGEALPIHQARDLFIRALSSGADEKTIFHALIALELGHGDVAAARSWFEEWRRWHGDGRRRRDTNFWCDYIWFEIQHGTATRSRYVAEVSSIVCPRDPVLFALYAKMELRLGCHRRARHIVRQAHEILTADVYPVDEDAAKWVADDVERYRQYLREEAAKRPTIVHVFRCLFCGGVYAA